MIITVDDKRWLTENYPKLYFSNIGIVETIEGEFEFSTTFDTSKKEYIVNPSFKKRIKFKHIHDIYNIRITLPNKHLKTPKVQEISGRIKELAKKLDLPLEDLHLYNDGSGCLLGKLDETKNFTLEEFINGPVLQFFYDESHFEKFKTWPRGTYSHGYLGIIENYYDKIPSDNHALSLKCINELKQYRKEWPRINKMLIQKNKIRGHWFCLCESKEKFRKCHPSVFKGLWHLQNNYKKNS